MAELLLRGQKVADIKGVLFDKDGTLLNSEAYLLKLSKERINQSIKSLTAFNKSTREINTLKRLLNRIYGIKKRKIDPNSMLAIASKEHNLISTATIISLLDTNWSESLFLAKEIFLEADEILSIEEKKLVNNKFIFSGVKEFLSKLNKYNVKSALISNDTEKGLKDFIEINNLEKLINYLWSADHYPQKPNPLAIIKLCKLMNIHPSDCALVSDAETDLKMAREAEIGLIIGFRGGWQIQPDLNEKDFMISHWNELKIL